MPKDQLADWLAYNNLKVGIHLPLFFIMIIWVTHILFSLFWHNQGLILSNALKAQKDVEDEGTWIAFRNLRSEVIDLWRQAKEKEKILTTLASELTEDHAEF